MSKEILTGNELTSGATVYLSASGDWVEALAEARLFATEDAADNARPAQGPLPLA